MYDRHGKWIELVEPISIRKVMIAYHLRGEERENAAKREKYIPEIALIEWPDAGDISRAWHSTTGASYTFLHGRKAGPLLRQCFVHSTALGLIGRDGYTFEQVHEALWWVKEYRDGLVPDQKSPDGKTVAAPGVI